MKNQSGRTREKRVTVSLKVNLQLPDRDAFEQHFAQNLSRTGVFIRSKEPVPVGSRINFDYRLSDDSRIMRGMGVVRWVRTAEEAEANDVPPGMGVEFVDVDPQTEQLIGHIVATHGEGEHAPRKKAKATQKSKPAPPASAAPITEQSTGASLDDEEFDALSMFSDGDALDSSPQPETAPEQQPIPQTAPPENEVPPPEKAPVQQASPEPESSTEAAVDDGSAFWIDLCGANIHAISASDGIISDPCAVIPAFSTDDGKLRLNDDGAHLTHLLSWFDAPWPSAPAISVASRSGIELSGKEEAPICSIGGHPLPLNTALQAMLKLTLRQQTADGAAPAAVAHVVVPSATSQGTRELVADTFGALGVGSVAFHDGSAAILRCCNCTVGADEYSLVMHLEEHQSALTILDHNDMPVGTRILGTLNRALLHKQIFGLADAQFLRELELDVSDDMSLSDALNQQIGACMDEPESSWKLTIAGAEVRLDAEAVTVVAAPLAAQLLESAVDLAARSHVAPTKIRSAIASGRGTMWPSLGAAFEQYLSTASLQFFDPGDLKRIHALLT